MRVNLLANLIWIKEIFSLFSDTIQRGLKLGESSCISRSLISVSGDTVGDVSAGVGSKNVTVTMLKRNEL